eukprot:m51a1_g784 hypothetical protein (833) ;mRNA; f:621190-624073
MSALLFIEKKRSERVELARPMLKFLSASYDEASAREFEHPLHDLQQLREDVRNSADKSDATKDLHLRYLTMLRSIEGRFPIGEAGNSVRIAFPWFDTFKGRKVSMYSVAYERANVMFNTAALFSQLAVFQNRATEDGIKQAANYFQLSAGTFAALADHVAQHTECQTALPDLCSGAVRVLGDLMLANAQFCFYEKAEKSNMSKSVLSKLVAGAASLYDSAARDLTTVASAPRTYAAFAESMSALSRALASLHAADELVKAMKYGECVARLSQASGLVEEARKKASGSFPDRTLLDSVAASVSKVFKAASKDNDTIYHEAVPAVPTLQPIAGRQMVKALPPPDAQVPDVFEKLVPPAVREAVRNYQTRKDELVRAEIKTIEDYNNVVKTALTTMNLPGAIEALEAPSGVPQSLLDKCKTVRAEGGIGPIEENMHLVASLSKTAAEILAASLKALDDEEREDNEMRAVHGSRWTCTPSHTLTASLRKEGATHQQNTEHAAKSDALLARKWADHREYLVAMSDDNALRASLPETASSLLSDPAVSAAVAEVKSALLALDAAVAARDRARADLQDAAASDNPAVALLAEKDQLEAASQRLLTTRYSPMQNAIRESCASQEQLLARVRDANKKFCDAKQRLASGGAGGSREAVLQQYAGAYTTFMDLRNGLKEGVQFYMTFQDHLNRFRVKCDDFALARRTEREDLVQTLQGGSFPPPRPEKPANLQPVSYNQPPQIPGGWQPSGPSVYQQGPPSGLPQPPMTYAYPPPQQYPPPSGYQQPPYGQQPYGGQQVPGYGQQPPQYGTAPPYPMPPQSYPYGGAPAPNPYDPYGPYGQRR